MKTEYVMYRVAYLHTPTGMHLALIGEPKRKYTRVVYNDGTIRVHRIRNGNVCAAEPGGEKAVTPKRFALLLLRRAAVFECTKSAQRELRAICKEAP